MANNDSLAILFSDIVGYTELTSTQSRLASRRFLKAHDRTLLPICRAFGGRHVKSIGDAILITFRSPTDAVRCGMDLQNAAARLRQQPEFKALRIRVAINLGEVRVERNDVFGEAVNVASRVQALAPPDEVYFTEAVYLAMNKAEVSSAEVGVRELRGIPEPVHVYRAPPRQTLRLVAAGEPGEEEQETLPFGDIPVPVRSVDRLMAALRRRLANVSARATPAATAAMAQVSTPVRWMVAGAIALALAVPLSMYFLANRDGVKGAPSTALTLDPGETLLDQGDKAGLAQLVAERLRANPRDAQALLLRGHLEFAGRRKLPGVASYSKALALDPSLRENPRMAGNLIALFDQDPAAVRPLLLLYPSEAVLQGLAQRTGEPGYYGRAEAARLLTELGQSKRIDRFNYAVQELAGRSDCADRLKAVRELRALKDPRAIPHLEKAVTGGLMDWFRQGCLRGEALATIAELRAVKSRAIK